MLPTFNLEGGVSIQMIVLYEYHRHALHAHNNAHPDHRSNIDVQYEQMIYHLECVASYVIVHMIDVKLYKFYMLKKIS